MANYLRFIDYRFTDAAGQQTRDDVIGVQPVAPEVYHLQWMYEHLATPLPSGGVSKVNIYFTPTKADREPTEVLGIAEVYESFDISHFMSLSANERQHYFLERFHAAMLRCAKHFRWEKKQLEEAHRQIVDKNFHFTIAWKKPLASPDRRVKVQAFVEASSFPAHLYLIFFDREMQPRQRTLLSVGTNGPGSIEFALGEIRWIDSGTVRIQHQNKRDYWLCTTDGGVSFHYPRAEANDPHGLYDLGKMYVEGQWVLQDRNRGIELIRASAALGFNHAIRFLASIEETR